RTVGATLRPKTRPGFSPFFGACIREPSMPVTGSGWRFARKLSNNRGEESGWNRNRRRAPLLVSRGRHRRTNRKKRKPRKAPTEVLLVDDNPGDVDLTAEVLSQNNCPSRIHSVVDGVE